MYCLVAAATDEDATDVATATDETFDSVDATDVTDWLTDEADLQLSFLYSLLWSRELKYTVE